jgi:phosphopantothenoylcysteine decarboxylase/phosphopantothenate--cysteine ligase
MLGRWADLMLVAPLSCNTLAKMSSGLCDNMMLATYLSAICPVIVAPAMDEDMWKHPATLENLAKLRDRGNYIIPVDNGELASGLIGEGRMAEPEKIISYLTDNFFLKQDLEGKKVLVTAGPTHEPLDPVRFISNHSSGKMGIALSEEFARRGASVQLVLGPTSSVVSNKAVNVQKVETAEEMYQACIKEFETSDIAVMSAAVADYTPVSKSVQKIKKNTETFSLDLSKTRDILKTLGEKKYNGQLLVGFALETNNEKEYAIGKLKSKNADLIILNSMNDEGAGFGFDTNKITIFERGGNEIQFDRKPKQQVAKDIVDRIVNMLHG